MKEISQLKRKVRETSEQKGKKNEIQDEEDWIIGGLGGSLVSHLAEIIVPLLALW